ncbi:hypothetical protein [Streptomyces sp. 891-h]|uniref:hypothetical protein n=1 Tax=Streptomyces sp. 891-h TaxID=2720714 RepID=UPI001FA9876A|nr:hypothetical protein [Streptomyces sp. 891-h]UNZ17668.1 hypothetical protein HC362_11970 [Streptomyces sp. 891-h]
MADDRYSWLDEETAERLLRGLPVDACEGDDPGTGFAPGSEPGAGSRAHTVEGAAEEQNAGPGAAGPGAAGSRAAGPGPARSQAAGRPEGYEPSALPEESTVPGEPREAAVAGRMGRARRNGRPGRRAEGRLDVPSHDWSREADRRTVVRLAAALDELSTACTAPTSTSTAPGATPVELPGEAAALDAFRAARVGAPRGVPGAATVTPLGGGGAPGGARSRARNLLTGRPLRAGFAVALAGCALGGVAVAAGTGMLPTPFSNGEAPSVSVSPGDTSQGKTPTSGGASSDDETPGSDGKGDRHNGAGLAGGHDGDGKGGDGDKSRDGSRDLADSGGAGRDKSGKGRDNDKPAGKQPGSGGHLDDSQKDAIATALCKAYAADKLDVDDRRKLERAAGGRTVVRKFCAQHGNSGSGDGGSRGGASDGGGQGSGDSGGDGGGQGSGSDSGGGGGGGGSTGGDGDPPPPGDSGGSATGGSGAADGDASSPSSAPSPSSTSSGTRP